MTAAVKTRPQVATMNAVHDLPVLVARDEGFYKDEGLDIEFVTTPGMAQVSTSHFVKFDSVFDRPLDSVYNDGGIDQYRMCEWGIMKRAVEANAQGLRGRKIVALGASMSKFAIVVSKDSKIYEPEMLKDQPIAVTPNNGSDFTTLKMIEGFLEPKHVKRTNAGSMLKRLEAAGFVARNRSGADERQVFVSLTAAGKRLRERAVAIPGCVAAAMECSPGEIDLLRSQLKDMRSKLYKNAT